METINKQVWSVPAGVRYMNDWTDFMLPDCPHIMNKVVTGCGFTEYFLRPNPKYPKVILVSPRRILLENKEEQHNKPKDGIDIGKIYYAKNDYEQEMKYDIDMSSKKPADPELVPLTEEEKKNRYQVFQQRVRNYVESCWYDQRDIRIIVTYDSFRLVKEALGADIYNYQIVVDEFQSVLQDSKFKSSTEIELLYHLQDLQHVCFLSATPMLDKYMLRLSSFRNLPFIELDWESEDKGRIIKPQIDSKQVISITNAAKEEIDKYLNGNFERCSEIDTNGFIHETFSDQLVVFCNSVKNISDIIRKCNLTPEQCNILCADTKENKKKLKDAFKKAYENLGKTDKEIKELLKGIKIIGKVPQRGDFHKMFTFCTRTVYLGADFYSPCARSLVLSDANIDCLAVDISMDLLQIMGRQRLEENPWKNCIMFRFKTNTDNMTEEEFNKKLEEKIESTKSLLRTYERALDSDKTKVAEAYEYLAKTKKYKDDFVSVNEHAGSSLMPVFNELVMVAEQRAYDIQHIDYADRVSIMREVDQRCRLNERNEEVSKFLNTFNSIGVGKDKMKFLCEFFLDPSKKEYEEEILINIPLAYKNYYVVLGPRRCYAFNYRMGLLENEYQKLLNNQKVDRGEIDNLIYDNFKEGERYTMTQLKEVVQGIYDSVGLKKTGKASDFEQWFKLKKCLITNPQTKKRENGFELVKRKL